MKLDSKTCEELKKYLDEKAVEIFYNRCSYWNVPGADAFNDIFQQGAKTCLDKLTENNSTLTIESLKRAQKVMEDQKDRLIFFSEEEMAFVEKEYPLLKSHYHCHVSNVVQPGVVWKMQSMEEVRKFLLEKAKNEIRHSSKV